MDTLEKMYITPSVDKEQFAKPDLYPNLAPQETAVFNGDFFTHFGGMVLRGGQGMLGGQVAALGAGSELIGSFLQKHEGEYQEAKVFFPGQLSKAAGAPVDENERHYGERLVNFGLYMTSLANEMSRLREEESADLPGWSKFGGDVISSLATSIGLYYVGGPGAAIGVLSAESGAQIGQQVLHAGRSPETSLATAIIMTPVQATLERIGFSTIIDKTMGRGVGLVAKYITEAIAKEGATEAAQTALELAVPAAFGAYPDMTMKDFLSQTIYAASVGAFAGGGMVASVAIPQRAKAISIVREAFGVDTKSATNIVDTTMQQQQNELLVTMGNETQFSDVMNGTMQSLRTMYNTARGETSVSKEQARQAIEAYKAEDPFTPFLNELRAEAEADARTGVMEGEITGRTTKGTKQAKKAQEMLDVPRETARLPKVEETILRIDNQLGDEFKAAVQGRMNWLRHRIAELKYNMRQQYHIDPNKTVGIADMAQEESTLTSEYLAIANDPNVVSLEEGRITVPMKTIQRLGLQKMNTVLRQAKQSFVQGQKSVRAELDYIKGVLNGLIDQVGISPAQKNELKGKYRTVDTTAKLLKRLPDIEMYVNELIDQNLIGMFKTSIDSAIDIMKGKGSGKNRKVNLPVQQQEYADTFIKALHEEGIDPGVEQGMIFTPKGLMRTWAAQYKTGKNVYGQDMTARDYANIEQGLRTFISIGTLAQAEALTARKKTKENMIKKVRTELEQGAVQPKTVVGKTLGGVLNTTLKWAGNLDSLTIGLLRGMGEKVGSSTFKNLVDTFTGMRVYETVQARFRSQYFDGMKKVFGLKSTEALMKKLVDDKATNIQIVDPKTGEITWDKSTAITRDRYMIWLSPDGKKELMKQGWTEEFADQVAEALGPQNLAAIEVQLQVYEDMYEEANKVFRNRHGFDLPRYTRYSPWMRTGFDIDHVSLADQVTGTTWDENKNVYSQRFMARTGSNEPFLDIADDQKMQKYIKDISYYIGMADTADRIWDVLSDSKVREHITKTQGEHYLRTLERFARVNTRNSIFSKEDDLDGVFTKWVNNFNKMVLAAKPNLIGKQLVSGIAAMDTVSPGKFFQYISEIPEAMRSGSMDKFLDHPYFKSLGQKRNVSRDLQEMNDFLERSMASAKNAKLAKTDMTLNHYLFLPTQLGDLAGRVVNGWAIYRHGVDTGLSESEAMVKAVRHINETQQSTDYSQMSSYALKGDPLSRSVTAFTHAPMQYVNKMLQEFMTVGTTGFDAKRFARKYAVYMVALNLLYSMV